MNSLAQDSTDDAPEQRLHPWSWLFVLLQQLRQFLLPLVALVVFGRRRDDDDWLSPLLTGGVIVVLMTVSVAQYWTYRYRVGRDAITIRSGLFSRNRREIPFARIHNVTVHQTVLHRLFGVAELRLESAGGIKPEAQMQVLKLADALALEQLVRHRGSEPPPLVSTDADGAAPAAPPALLQLGVAEVVRLGLISNRAMVAIVAAIGAAYQLFPRRSVSGFITDQIRDVSGHASHLQVSSTTLVLSGVVMAILAVALLQTLSVIITLVQYYGFRLTEADRRLTVERGLLTRLRTSAARRRIQAWTLREGPLHRLFGRRSLRIDSASGNASDENSRTLRELAPIATPQACDALVRHLLPGVQWPPGQWQAVAQRGWWRLCLASACLVPLLTAALYWRIGPWGLLLSLWLPWSAFKAQRQIRYMGYAVDTQRVAVRGGWWSRWWRFAELDKLQALRLERSPLDRWLGTASLWLDTAGAGASPALCLRYLPQADAERLLHELSHGLARRKLRW